MINTSIHGVTQLAISEPLSTEVPGGGLYYYRTLNLATKQGKCTIEMFGESPAALSATESAEANYWREAAADASARADAAEAELLRLHRAIDRITDGETS